MYDNLTVVTKNANEILLKESEEQLKQKEEELNALKKRITTFKEDMIIHSKDSTERSCTSDSIYFNSFSKNEKVLMTPDANIKSAKQIQTML